jgi:hypothetical protein
MCLFSIIIFDNFGVIFDLNFLERQIFVHSDGQREIIINRIIDRLRLRYNQGADNCRFIFSNNIFEMPIDMTEKSIIHVHNSNDMNNYLSISANIFCFKSTDQVIAFNTYFLKMYNQFILSSTANHLYYYNKLKINKLKVVFRNMVQHQLIQPESGFDMNIVPVSEYNLKYGVLEFSKDGALISDSIDNNLNIIYSFNYENIKDCKVSITDKKYVLPRQFMPNSNKCCLKLIVDVKDVYDNMINLCSYQLYDYQCNLQIKFIQESLINRCSHKLVLDLDYVFMNNVSVKEYLSSNFCLYRFYIIFAKIRL